jgi:hypothetical protein
MSGSVVRVSLSDNAALRGRQLVEKSGVHLRVGDVRAEVSDSSGAVGSSKVVVHPSDQDLFRGESKEILESLTFIEQKNKLREVVERNGGKKLDLDDLPDQTKDENRSSFYEILRSNVGDLATNSFGSIDSQVSVLSLLVDVHIASGV